MARPSTHHDEKKLGLIKIAFGLFMKNGYEDTSINDILKVAQISKGAMYHYFTCKEDILDEVLNYILDIEMKRAELILNNATLRPIEKLAAMMSLDRLQTDQEVQQAVEYTMQRTDSIFNYRARELSQKRSIPVILSIIQEGIAVGEFHTKYPEEMVGFMYVSVQSLGEVIMHQTDMLALRRNVEALIDLLTYCLGLEKEEQDFLTALLESKIYFGKQM